MIWAQGAKPCIHWPAMVCHGMAIWDFPFGSGGAAYIVCALWPVPGVAPRGDHRDSTPLGAVLPLPYPRLRLEYGWRDMRHHASKLLCYPKLGGHHMPGGTGRWQG